MPRREPADRDRRPLFKTEISGQGHEMIWIAIHHLSMRTARAPKDPVAHLPIDHLATYLFNGPGHFHSHNEGQFLTTVVTRAHAHLRKIDATGLNTNAHRLRGKITQR